MHQSSRRSFATGALSAAAAGLLAVPAVARGEEEGNKRLILGVSCSPRKGKTTATAVQESLHAASEAGGGRIETQLLDLGGMTIHGWSPDPSEDDLASLLPVLKSDNLAGLVIGSPVYFRSISALCKAFLERLAVLRTPELRLAGKVVGAVSVGAYRNGGQELAISEIHNTMLCHEAVIVGGKAGAFQGATLLNTHDDDITKDELGMESARKLGIRVAEAVLL